MYYNRFLCSLLIVALIAGVSVSSGCSQADEQKKKADAERVLQEKKREEFREQLRQQIRKEQEARFRKGSPGEGKAAKKYMANAESCMKQFQKCVDTCTGKNCEDRCLKFLAACEKDLPVEFQTLKKE